MLLLRAETSRSSGLTAFHVASECWEEVSPWERAGDRKRVLRRLRQLQALCDRSAWRWPKVVKTAVGKIVLAHSSSHVSNSTLIVCPVVVEFYRLHKLGGAGPGPLLRVSLTYWGETVVS